MRGRAGFSRKKFLFQKWVKNRVFLIYWKKIYWIWPAMKIYIICCVPAQIPYLGKFWFLRYRPKFSQPIRQQDFLINHISRTNQWISLILRMLIQISVNQKLIKNFWMGIARNRCGQSGHRTLKVAVSQEWIDGVDWFFAWWCKFRKAKKYFSDFWVNLVMGVLV